MKLNNTFFLFFFLLFYSGQISAHTSTSVAEITSVKFGNNQVNSILTEIDLSLEEDVNLFYDQNYLHFNFINTTNPSNKTFYYRLVGLDYSWIRCDDCGQVQYAHLTGGNYTFQVRTSAEDTSPAEFKFFVEGDILHKWWFVPMLFLYVFLFLGIGIYFIVLYNFRQKFREQRLIHTGKMNSMAELTEGIAHEIQNPLNFVNNYSEVSRELVDELMEERLKKSDARDEELISDLLGDLRENLTKILSNGKRADSIVKGLLQHSRRSSGFRDPSDLNALVKEYLQQAYDTQRDRDPSFHAQFHTRLDKGLPQVELVVLDIGQVLLNLMNNAFYAVHEKRKHNSEGYVPEVGVSTHRQGETVEIRVRDNGGGVEEAIRDKIFLPFFTTKPAGQGTGLGLSVSDTIVKAHGGQLYMDTVVGEGTTFTLVLPL